MSALHPDLRRRLERDVVAARKLAEKGSEAALARLGVGDAKIPAHLSGEEKKLRVALRARSRQLGDQLRADKSQQTRRLMLEGGYEHWHQLLFTRFLAENNLLVTVDGVPITLEECDELAVSENAPDGLSLAMRYASRLLPQIFRPDDPLLRITFAPEHLQPLRRLVAELPVEIFRADDSLGWVYQLWRAEEKDSVNRAGDKINADTLPAVTQLFTEHYMVEFLLHNTLGAWWTAKVEATGRTSAIPLPYLRHRDDASPAGAFPRWPKSVRELRVLDPCCGSGHFLVALLQLIVAMLREEEKLSAEQAVRVVLGDILHGLELDARCTQLAAFNVAFAAWRLIGHPVALPPLRIACSGLSVGATREEWLAAVEDKDARFFIGQLYDLFKRAPELGSLINPTRLSNIGRNASDLLPVARGLLAADPLANPERHELGVTAKGLADAAGILVGTFHLVATNVPYLGRGDQSEALRDFVEKNYASGKADLATGFTLRCLEFCRSGGTAALLTPQNWLFMASYKKLREELLERVEWNFVARLGEHGFESSAAAGAFTAMFGLTLSSPTKDHRFAGIDVADEKTPLGKDRSLRERPLVFVGQGGQLNKPDARVSLDEHSDEPPLSKYCSSFLGLGTGDYSRYGRCFWEFPIETEGWAFQQGTVESPRAWGGCEHVLAWDRKIGRVRGMSTAEREQIHNQDQSGQQAWGKRGVALGLMRGLKSVLYSGEVYEKALAILVPHKNEYLPAIWALCSSPDFNTAVRKLDHNIIVANGTLVKIPFDLARWQKVAAEKYPKGLPKPHSDDPTQWLFNGQPRDSLAAAPNGASAPLQVAVARLLGYRWPRQTGSEFPDCPSLGLDGLETFADEDGIVCFAPLRGERPAPERLQQLLAKAYGKEWKPAVLDHLLAEAGYGGKTLDDWLRDGFFEQHCQLFHQRPFVWQIWDGQKRGFSVLVNYHRLDHALLTKLIYSYLGDWISDRKRDVEADKSGSDALHLAAVQLQNQLKGILEGEAPYDIFVRWKPLEKQPIGWHPDLNDGVRLNIRPFTEAGILRKTPKIKWGVDRGKNPPGAPWVKYAIMIGT